MKISNLPSSPGVYIFKNKSGEVLYIGKAASLKSRVRSYFGKSLAYERPIEFVMDQVAEFEVEMTDSVIEAYFLEQELIKRYQPKYNVLGKDDKSFVYVCVTREDFPRFEIRRKTDLYKDQKSNLKNQNDLVKSLCSHGKGKAKCKNDKKVKNEIESLYSRIYGPYGARHQVETALRILRKIFPYHDRKQPTEKGCLDYQIGLCPGPHAGMISKAEYAKNIKGIEMMFRGKKKMLIRKLEREMEELAKKKEFEKAAGRRNQVFALKHIRDIALISNRNEKLQITDNKLQTNSKFKIQNSKFIRVEAYDISHISGKFATASMVVFDNSSGEFEANKSQYRKFKIKSFEGNDDVRAMKEALKRRFSNSWPTPDLILLDGGKGQLNMASRKGQLNMASRLLKQLGISIPLVAIAKGPTRKISNFEFRISNQEQISDSQKKLMQKITGDKNISGLIMGEAHRFAVSYHRKLRGKSIRQG